MLSLRFMGRLDPTLLIIVALLLAVGLLMIYSSTRASLASSSARPTKKVEAQCLSLVIALIALVLAASVDYEKIVAVAMPIMGAVGVLLLVVLFNAAIRHTYRWIEIGPLRLQPSELAKVAVILVLAAFLASREDEVDTLSLVSRSLVYAAIPAGLIFLQPDLGTPVVLMCVWLTMLFVAGARMRHLAAYVLAAVVLFGAAWNVGIIRPHQKERLLSFVDPDKDARGSGYHLRQSMIAIGSGGLWGQGLFRGKQTQLGFVPDQETDFIFTAVGEELGFAGSLLVILLFAALVWRTYSIAASARDMQGRLIAVGIAAVFCVHVVVNISMTIGLMPVKGLPLPFVSYGGSNLLANAICVGLLQNIHMRRHKITF